MKNMKVIGILFVVAAVFFAMGTINHILYTGEEIISSVCLALGCVCAAVFSLRKSS